MASQPSTSPSSKQHGDLKSSAARRSLPRPTTRASMAHRMISSSPISSSAPLNSENSRPLSLPVAAIRLQRLGPKGSSGSNISRPSPALSRPTLSNSGKLQSKPQLPRSTGPEAGSSIRGNANPSHRHESPSSSTAASPTNAFGFLTPASAASRSLATGKKMPTTPEGPKRCSQIGSSSTAPARTPSKKAASPYLNTHVADPCIPGCLVHQLSPCGHKVITTTPDPCASNCRRPLEQQPVSIFANLLQSTQAFVCAACVELHVQSHRETKRILFREQMAKSELQMGGFPPEWFEEQSKYWERVWDNDVQAERAQFERLGRKCHAIPGGPIQDGEARGAATFSSTPYPWPPSKRPSASRSTKGDAMAVSAGRSVIEQ